MSYFSRVRLRRDASPQKLAAWALHDRYQEHRMVWRFFAEEQQERDFLYRREQEGDLPCFYLLSERLPQNVDDLWQIESKSYQPRLHSGQRLAFRLRVNPVVTRKDAQGRRHRHDVVMNAKRELAASNIPKTEWPNSSELSRKQGLLWLQSRSEKGGFTVQDDQVLVEAYQQHQFSKRADRKDKVSLSTLDFSGVLSVNRVDDFLGVLQRGLGPAKGFGCGLLMVRPL